MAVTLTQEQAAELTSLRTFLATGPLQRIGATPADLEFLLNPSYLYYYWQPAFTSPIHSPDSRFNYELLENLGDAKLKGVFHEYLTMALPGMSPLVYTELNTYYMSNAYMRELTQKLEFNKYIRMKGLKDPQNIPGPILADVFEAFCGALVSIGNLRVRGLGESYLYNFIISIFNGVQFDMRRALGGAQTQVDQIFTRFGAKAPRVKEFLDPDSRYTTATIFLGDEQIQFLSRNGFNLDLKGYRRDKTGYIISTFVAPIRKEAVAKVENDMLNFLEKNGITSGWAEQKKAMMEFQEPEAAQHLPGALKRLQEGGYVSMIFDAPAKLSTIDGFSIMLIGIRGNGVRESILARYYERGPGVAVSAAMKSARADLLRRYATRIDNNDQ